MHARTCTRCEATLPLRFFQVGYGKTLSACRLCTGSDSRLRYPLAEPRRDPVQVRLNNTFNLWHGPVGQVPLRHAA